MPTVFTHAAVGLALAWAAPPPAPFWAASAALPVVPDLDVFVMALGVLTCYPDDMQSSGFKSKE